MVLQSFFLLRNVAVWKNISFSCRRFSLFRIQIKFTFRMWKVHFRRNFFLSYWSEHGNISYSLMRKFILFSRVGGPWNGCSGRRRPCWVRVCCWTPPEIWPHSSGWRWRWRREDSAGFKLLLLLFKILLENLYTLDSLFAIS